jgi:hypothetical protein
MYQNGQGVAQDDVEAARWYRNAADQGEAAAQSGLGIMYQNGQGVPQDDAEAMKWYRKAADQGDATAKKNLKAYDRSAWLRESAKKSISFLAPTVEQRLGLAIIAISMLIITFMYCVNKEVYQFNPSLCFGNYVYDCWLGRAGTRFFHGLLWGLFNATIAVALGCAIRLLITRK